MNIKLTTKIPCQDLLKGEIFKVLRCHGKTHVVVKTPAGRVAYIPRTRCTFINESKKNDKISKHT